MKRPHDVQPSEGGISLEIPHNVLAEWREDYRLAKLRDSTGKEPESRPIEATPKAQPLQEKAKPKRERLKSIDIPF